MKPTHTHRTQGGRFALVGQHHGSGPLDGQQLVIYQDLNRETQSVTTLDDWRQHWREVAADDCPVCLGSGHDHIKGNADKPCGYCFGLGKVMPDGEAPDAMWPLAEVALGIIRRQQQELEQRRRAMATPQVREAIQQLREQTISDSVTRQEQEWRKGRGHGPGGRRQTGD